MGCPLCLTAAEYAAYTFAGVAAARNQVAGFTSALAAGAEIAHRYRMTEAEAIQALGDAVLAHVAGRFDESERIYLAAVERLRRAGSVHADGFLVLALATLRLSQGRMAEMEPMLSQMSAAYPDGRDAYSLALVARGRLDEARAVRTVVPPLRPDYFLTLFGTFRALAVVAPSLAMTTVPVLLRPGSTAVWVAVTVALAAFTVTRAPSFLRLSSHN